MSTRIQYVTMITLLCFSWGVLMPGLLDGQSTKNSSETSMAGQNRTILEKTDETPKSFLVKEKQGPPGLKKKKKFPWLFAGLGVAAAAALIVLLGKKKSSDTASVPLPAFDMLAIPGGTFLMGSDSSGGSSGPVHNVTLSSFSIGKYEVTQGLWTAVMGTNPATFSRGDNYPVEQVSWNDIQEFLRRLNERTSLNYRLPTEAEWEYACRAGTTGDYYGALEMIGWFYSNSGGSTHPVGQKQANAWGLYDTIGNVLEWCSDWYDENYYRVSPASNPTGPASGSRRVYRGGSMESTLWPSCASRSGFDPDERGNSLGFRLAKN